VAPHLFLFDQHRLGDLHGVRLEPGERQCPHPPHGNPRPVFCSGPLSGDAIDGGGGNLRFAPQPDLNTDWAMAANRPNACIITPALRSE
jgi:hypothetical protein